MLQRISWGRQHAAMAICPGTGRTKPTALLAHGRCWMMDASCRYPFTGRLALYIEHCTQQTMPHHPRCRGAALPYCGFDADLLCAFGDSKNLSCLQDLVTPLIAESNLRTESPEDVGILILGDSADRNLAFDTCLSAAREVGTSVQLLPCMLVVSTAAKLSSARAGGMLVSKSSISPLHTAAP